MFDSVLWSQNEIEKLRKLLMDGKHTWLAIQGKFPNRTPRAIAAKARVIRRKNMYYVAQAQRAEERKKAKEYKAPPRKSNKSFALSPDRMVLPATADMVHASGERVHYA